MKLEQLINKDPQEYDSKSLWFQEIANCLLNQTNLVVNNQPHRFIEIEFYYRDEEDHNDPSVHSDKLQKTCGCWYFHRSWGQYKDGSFKGLDITFGDQDVFGGILIRGIEKSNGEAIDGPSLCVDYLLQQTNSTKVVDLDTKVSSYSVWDKNSPLSLVDSIDVIKKDLIATPRVGLTLKKTEHLEQMARFIMANYRYINSPELTRKGKVYTALSLYIQGKQAEQIRKIVGSTNKAIQSYIDQFKEGQALEDFSSYTGIALNTAKLAQLYGTWWKFHGAN